MNVIWSTQTPKVLDLEFIKMTIDHPLISDKRVCNSAKPSETAFIFNGKMEQEIVNLNLESRNSHEVIPSPQAKDSEKVEITNDERQEDQAYTASRSQKDSCQTSKLPKEEAKKSREELKQQQKIQRELKKEQEKRDREFKRELERREKEQKKLEDKKRKEDERRERELRKEEEKRAKEVKREQEKQERERRKEEDKQRKLEEKAKREEEKRQKEDPSGQNQSKIGSFFKKSNTSKSFVSTKTDFERHFLPFYVKDGTVMGKSFALSPDMLKASKSDIDAKLQTRGSQEDTVLWMSSYKQIRGYTVRKTAVELVQLMTSKDKTNQELEDRLREIPQKFIKFYENVRPPYIGTYSKDFKLPCHDPFSVQETGFDYDYDSDWDWINEEEEEGGEVDDLEDGDEEDEEEEVEDGTEGEFEGFLDHEESQDPRDGKKFLGPLIPVVRMRTNLAGLDDEDRNYFRMISVTCLLHQGPFSIDPTHMSPKAGAINKRTAAELDVKPEHPKSSSIDNLSSSAEQGSSQASPTRAKKARSIISDPDSLLKIFAEVHESTFSLGTVTEILQKQLSKHSKVAIRDTIKEYTTRPVAKAGSSRIWLVKDMEKWNGLKQNIETSKPDSKEVHH
ncbi:LADA_0F08834g1_1 [Lachancea dasiensis]|uniref:LADA_0F08834g1_1 n=1 Tax=Lachancea dasiensis TaxID=1072105 RepID=A0A1G4JLG2_9SACH|nr:LADA_0F08834g1_1 [Lachancea dasiensis]